MKKLIAFLKSLFCKHQDHTENNQQTDVKPPVEADPELVSDTVVMVDNIDTIIDECDCDENCECCDCNEESTVQDNRNCCDEEECTESECTCEDCECCDCDKESSNEDDCTCEECEVGVTVASKEELITDELKTWGIAKDTLGYNAIMAMIEIKDVTTYDDITTKLSETLGKTKAAISTSLKALVNKANFEESLFTSIKNINKEDNFKAIVEVIYCLISRL